MANLVPPPTGELHFGVVRDICEIDYVLDFIRDIDYQDEITHKKTKLGVDWEPFMGDPFFEAFQKLPQPVSDRMMEHLVKSDPKLTSHLYKKLGIDISETENEQDLGKVKSLDQQKDEAKSDNVLQKEIEILKIENQDIKTHSRQVTKALIKAKTRERHKLSTYNDEAFIEICDKYRKKNGTLNILETSKHFGVSDQTIHNEIKRRTLGWLKTATPNTYLKNNYKECPACGTPTLIGTECNKCKQIKEVGTKEKTDQRI